MSIAPSGMLVVEIAGTGELWRRSELLATSSVTGPPWRSRGPSTDEATLATPLTRHGTNSQPLRVTLRVGLQKWFLNPVSGDKRPFNVAMDPEQP